MEVSVMTLAGVIITILLSIVGWFLSRLIHDVRDCISETGKNKGRIDLLAKQQENDIKRIEDSTQLELQALTKNVCKLSDNVNDLVLLLAEKGIKRGA
jgi:hypothetical protein